MKLSAYTVYVISISYTIGDMFSMAVIGLVIGYVH